jgi:hypothetical protein
MSILSRLKSYFRQRRLSRMEPQEIFVDYARRNKWRDKDSLSGKGSNLEATADLRRTLPQLLRDLDARSLLDLPCGDFFWMQHVNLEGIEYTGGDIVPALVERNRTIHERVGRKFEVMDLIKGPVPEADVILVRDCLVHLSSNHVRSALINIANSGSKWLLTTTYPETATNAEIHTGDWRAIDLTRPPFSLPPPYKLLFEGQGHVKGQRPDKALGLWRIADITQALH